MSQKIKTERLFSSHIANVVRRRLSSQFPDFIPIFILHGNDNRDTAIAKESRFLLSKPGGQRIMDKIRQIKSEKSLHTQFIGMTYEKQKSLTNPKGKPLYLAAFFINTEKFKSDFELRATLYHYAWHALALRNDFIKKNSKNRSLKKEDMFQEKDTFEDDQGLLRPKLNSELAIKRNLSADAFSAALQFIDGDNTAVRALASLRLKESVLQQPTFIAERYPYAICPETLEFVLENKRRILSRKRLAIVNALDIAESIGNDFNIPAISQWRSFAHAAQHMAWLGFGPRIILGTALYTGANPYSRTLAEMVGRISKIEPEIVTHLEDFNPFSSVEKSEIAHNRACKDSFRLALLAATNNKKIETLYDEAQKQNERLLMGNPHGWCAYSLTTLGEKYPDSIREGYDLHIKNAAESLFEKTQAEIPYEILLKFSVLAFQRLRNNNPLTADDVIKAGASNPDFAPISNAFLLCNR